MKYVIYWFCKNGVSDIWEEVSMNNIGSRIREFRKKSGMTQEKLAAMLGVTYQSVSKWENGVTMPDLGMIGPLTRVLHVSADVLLGLVPLETDEKKQKFDAGLLRYRDCEEVQLSYTWAQAALLEYPEEFRYMEWLAYAEYRLAFEDYRSGANSSQEFLQEMTDNALRRYETILKNCTDPEMVRLAAMGKVMVLRFCERTDEAEWSAEFEYPDSSVNTVCAVLSLTRAGTELLCMIDSGR